MKVKLQQLIQENQEKLTTIESTDKPKKKKKSRRPKKLKPLKQSSTDLSDDKELVGEADQTSVSQEAEGKALKSVPTVTPTKVEIPKIDDKLLYAKFKNESEWLKAVLKERKASLNGTAMPSSLNPKK